MLDKLRGTRLRVLLILVAVLLVGLFLWFVPKLQVQSFPQAAKVAPRDALAQEDEYRRTWAQIIGGLVLFAGLYFTWRRVEISQEQQVTERFTRAIDQLGATDDKGKKKLEIRLGGIYALERIARDSERDHWPIMETLTTYVRENAPWPPKKRANADGFLPPPHAAQSPQEVASKPVQPKPATPSPDPDIQAILTVLARRTRHFGNGELERIDLHATDLRGVLLDEPHLEGALLLDAHLERAGLRKAQLC